MDGFTNGSVKQYELARHIAAVFDGVHNKPRSVQLIEQGRFAVMVIGLASNDCQLRVLFFRTASGEEHVVQVNLTVRPMSASPRRIVFTSCWEELGGIFAGTPVPVLDERTFGEFMRHYDRMSEFLQNVLDAVEEQAPRPRRRMAA